MFDDGTLHLFVIGYFEVVENKCEFRGEMVSTTKVLIFRWYRKIVLEFCYFGFCFPCEKQMYGMHHCFTEMRPVK